MIRTVGGNTDRVIVIGAGLAGLSAALHLAGGGRQVTVLERDAVPGGRVGRMDARGYRIDTGPTVLTMPDIIDETFAAVGASRRDHLDLMPLAPAYRAWFSDGASLDVHTDADRMVAAIEQFAGHQQAAGYLRLRSWLTRLYQTEFDGFIAANFDSPLSLLTPQLARVAAIGGFRRWARVVDRFITDERLKRVFTFQSLYAGVAPGHALAVYAVIAYMDTVAGVFFPRGGMRALPDALAAAAVDAGVRFHYGFRVTGLERRNGRVTGVLADHGERIACDAVVLTTELPQTYRLLGRTPRRVVPLRPAPSAVVVHVGAARPATSNTGAARPATLDTGAAPPATTHHSILFGAAWEHTFTEIIDDGQPMTDPSLLVTRPTASDPSLAPADRDLLYILAPTPNMSRGTIDWSNFGGSYVDSLIDTVRDRLLPDLRDDAEVLHVVTPADWARQGMTAGTPFALAHTFAQTGPFRPANTVRGIDNAVLAGSSTVPGVGVPTALLSGRLAADRITGTTAHPVRPVASRLEGRYR
jgi:phytoene desaturase